MAHTFIVIFYQRSIFTFALSHVSNMNMKQRNKGNLSGPEIMLNRRHAASVCANRLINVKDKKEI